MENLLRKAVQTKRQFLINKLIQSGVYKKNNKHLYEWTLTELEQEYNASISDNKKLIIR
ncbi:Fur-regulated basic protein FbpA [Bacillus sp. AFS076308]|uniref:Fur-regulated basic protein FbpA n=1 Tax=unclassified Bacillus (in: firmicutes) TaxID=185979 RepID=UPI000BF99024|nr:MULTISPECIES: Fur-regulated basic protein FbpA [unclassified Bacillus (in: firmicutes)]PFO09654.1 Fur-regulated basic protein FbpA [Bacillus sp. AFS076308]PGV54820.1 Fur-regulated basic protein FbpA [Bacillus sp. AFS037270]